MRPHSRFLAFWLATGLAVAGCDRSSPTAPTDQTATTYRGTVVASADVLASGLRVVSDSGTSAAVSVTGTFEIRVTDRRARLRLVGRGIDLPITVSVDVQSDVVELELRVDGAVVIVVSACGVHISTSNGQRVEVRACVSPGR